MPHLYDYAVIRVVPRPERGEFINAGIVLSCPAVGLLDARVDLAEPRLLALCPDVDLDLVRAHLGAFVTICAGGPTAGAIGRLPPRERFHWLTAVRSTLIQTSPVHTGRCEQPAQRLDALLATMVRCPSR